MKRQSERTSSRRKPRFPRLNVLDLRRQAERELLDDEDCELHSKRPPRKS